MRKAGNRLEVRALKDAMHGENGKIFDAYLDVREDKYVVKHRRADRVSRCVYDI